MIRTKLLGALFVLLSYHGAAFAVPVKYQMLFGANAHDADGGVGSFYWDDATHLISNMIWDFGGGNSGGVHDALAGWSHDVFGGTRAEATFEILMTQDVHPANWANSNCVDGATSCSVAFDTPATGRLFGYPFDTMRFSESGPQNEVRYSMNPSSGPYIDGTLSVSIAPLEVPEPAPLALLGMGLASLVVSRRKL